VASVLSIESDVVFNCLVDAANIDTIALSESREASERALIYTNEKGEEALRGIIKNVYCGRQGDTWNIRNGSKAMFASNKDAICKKLDVDKSAAIEQITKEIDRLQEALVTCTKEESRLEVQHHQMSKAWNVAKRSKRNHDAEMDELARKIDEIQQEIDSSTAVPMDTKEEEREVEEIQVDLDEVATKRGDMEKEMESLKPDIKEAKAKVKDVADRIVNVLNEVNEANEKVTQCMESKTQMEEKIESRRQKLDKVTEVLKTTEEKLFKEKKEVNKLLVQAKTIYWKYNSARQPSSDSQEEELSQDSEEPTPEELEKVDVLNPEKTTEQLESSIKKTEQKIEAEKKKRNLNRESPSDAMEKYKRAMGTLSQKRELVSETKDKLYVLEEDLAERRKKWRKFRKFLEKSTGSKFRELLAVNNYNGSSSFDHESKTLSVAVSKEKDKACRNDVKALSGGERSYCTICLLLALGEKLENPFRIMDEFDVFLDAKARRLVLQMLIELAKTKMSHRQFIFITPQDLNGINQDEKLKIHSLKPPERRNGVVGGPTQQTLD